MAPLPLGYRNLAERIDGTDGVVFVTLKSWPTHWQVDRLEQDLADVRRNGEVQAAAVGERAKIKEHLEEYRTRAQQALKRANEVTTQTASEKRRLEVTTCS